jgi:hypothetical protein
MKRFQTYLQEANAIDTMQGVLDVATLGGSFVPGLNLASAAAQSVNAGIDVAQGQYGEAGMRAGMAALSAIPFGRAAGAAAKAGKAAETATKLGKVARAAKVAGAIATTVGPPALKWAANKLMAGQDMPGPGVEGGIGGNVGYVSSLAGKKFDIVDVPKSLIHDVVYR